ncbi:MAG: RpiB/LacA/LacB family sugar-phosphate isomerase [Patescibacteria group bacterium]
MLIYLGSDHAGFELKEKIKKYLKELGYAAEDKGAFKFDPDDDYPDFIRPVAEAVAASSESRGLIFGGSGQGEAIVANRVKGIRAAVFYGVYGGKWVGFGDKIVRLSRDHNDANILSIGARFVDENTAKNAVRLWLKTPFSGEARHRRRIDKIDPKN